MIKHAFYIMAHKQPELLERIISKIEKDNHYIYVHYDKKSDDGDVVKKICARHKNVFFLSSYSVAWGGWSQTKCILYGMQIILESEEKYHYFHLLSGNDYPCVDMDKFDSFFDENNGKSFMKLDSDEETEKSRKSKFKYRLENFFVNDVCPDIKLFRIPLYKLINKLIRIIPRPYKEMNKIYGGWNWCSLSRECINYIIGYIDDNKDWFNRFKWTLNSDELVFSTILKPVASQYNIDIGNSLRFVEWNPKRETQTLPLILQETELSDILDSNAFFCRKVQLPESLKLLDLLDETLDVKVDKNEK